MSASEPRNGYNGRHYGSEDDESRDYSADIETPLLQGATATATYIPGVVAAAASSPHNPHINETAAPPSPKDGPFLCGVSVARFRVIYMQLMVMYFIVCFDGTIMASSHPVITSYFGASNKASWLSTAFTLTSTVFMPLMGRLSDSMGRKPLYIWTTTIFIGATVWCASAQSMTSFIAARAICGLGAGSLMAIAGIMISDLVPIEIRGTYQAFISVAYGLGSMAGAALGGIMADQLGWRWEFGIQVPPLIVALIVAVVVVPADIGLYDNKRQSLLETLKTFDISGSTLMAVSVTFLILGLNLGGNILPWSHPFIIVSLIIFVIGFPWFFYVESRAEKPIMPLDLLSEMPQANLLIGNHIAAILLNAILFNIPLYFQGVFLTSATTSGLYIMLPSLIASLTGVATGILISKTRRLKWPLVLGTGLFFVGLLCLTTMRRSWPAAAFLLALVPSSMAQGLQFPGTFMALLAVCDQRRQAVVTTTLVLWRSLGNVLGVAGSSLVVQNALLYYLREFVDVGSEEGKEEIIALVRSKVEAVRDLAPGVQEQVIRSYESALRMAFGCSAALALVSCLIIAPVKLPRLQKKK